jgi:ABC-type branched-subunit amino acid transport system ATPase component
MANSLLEIKDLVSGYGKLDVLYGVSLNVSAGSLTAVVGPNGAGKSTLMNSIMNLIKVKSGEVYFKGQRLNRKDPSEITAMGIGYVPQLRNVFPEMTVAENLEMGAFTLLKTKKSKNVIDKVYQTFPCLEERKNQRASTLSGGERQMLAIGSALLLEPELLILDEPTTGLAPSIVGELIESITQIKEGGATLIWVVEDNPMQVLPLADRVYVMEGGVIKAEKAGMEFINEPDFTQMFLGYCKDT